MASPDPALKAAIFDIGATLITGPLVAPNKVIAGLIEGASAADVASVIMTCEFESAEAVCRAIGDRFGGLTPDAVASIMELWESQASAARALDGAAETVIELKRRGLKIGLLSDIWSPYFASVEKTLPDVIRAADAIVLSCRTGCRKPRPDNFLRALAELSVEPGEAMMIGDTYEHDILPALELGMRAVWVLARPDREAQAIIRVLNGDWPRPTFTVPSIADVLALDLRANGHSEEERRGICC